MRQIFDLFSDYFWIILGVACALPFFILTMYAHPLGLHDWDWSVMFSHEIGRGLTFLEQQSYFYNNVMGRYASTAVTSTLQYWFSPTNFKIFLISFFLIFLWSIYFFTHSLFRNFLPQKHIWSIYGSVICLYFAQLTSPYEAFYNISCITTYNLSACIFLIFLGLFVRRLQGATFIFQDLVLILLGIFIIGSNEITLIATNWTLLLIIIGKRYYKLIWDKSIILIFLIIFTFSVLAVMAPGNYVRMGYEQGAQSIPEALFYSIGLSIFNWLRWISSTPLILCILLYLPVGLKISRISVVQNFFNYPLLSGLGILILQPACLFILFYSAGITTFPERIMDLLFLMSLTGGFYFLQSIFVQIRQKEIIKENIEFPRFLYVVAGLFIACQLFFAGLNIDKSSKNTVSSQIKLIQTNSNSSNAWLAILSGDANVYDKGMKQLNEEIKKCNSPVCVVSTPKAFPMFIYDKIYDRKALKGGVYIGEYFHPNQKMRVIYDENPNKNLLFDE